MNLISFRNLKRYKYQLLRDYKYQTAIRLNHDVKIQGFITLSINGLLTIAKGYAWDGPSGPTIDTKNFMRGSPGARCFISAYAHETAFRFFERPRRQASAPDMQRGRYEPVSGVVCLLGCKIICKICRHKTAGRRYTNHRSAIDILFNYVIVTLFIKFTEYDFSKGGIYAGCWY
jgi:hypothetical protein